MPKRKEPESPTQGTIEELKQVEVASQEASLENAFHRGSQQAFNEALAHQAGYVRTWTELTGYRTVNRVKAMEELDSQVLETKVAKILEEGGVPSGEDPLAALPATITDSSLDLSQFL